MGDLRRAFGQRVRQLRKAKGKDWTQEKLAEAADLHYTYIGSVERGEVNLSFDNIVKIARGLNVDISALFVSLEHADSTEERELLRSEINGLIADKDLKTLRLAVRVLKDVFGWTGTR